MELIKIILHINDSFCDCVSCGTLKSCLISNKKNLIIMSAKKLQNKNFTFNEMSEEQISSELLAKHIFFFQH